MDVEVTYVVVVFASTRRVARSVLEVVVASGQPVAVVVFAGDVGAVATTESHELGWEVQALPEDARLRVRTIYLGEPRHADRLLAPLAARSRGAHAGMIVLMTEPALEVERLLRRVATRGLPIIDATDVVEGLAQPPALAARVAEVIAAAHPTRVPTLHTSQPDPDSLVLERVLDHVPALVFIAHDPQARRVTGNAVAAAHMRAAATAPLPVTQAMTGATPRVRMLHQGRELRPDELAVVRAARGETLRGFDVEVRAIDGTVRHLLGNAAPLRDEHGQPRGGLAAFIDVTDLVSTQRALAASEARFHGLAATAQDFITRFDRAQRLLYANPAVCRRMATSLEALIGKSGVDLGQGPRWGEQLGAVFASGRPARFDYEAANGTCFDVQLSPELDGDQVVSVISVARDVTAHRQAEAALRASEQLQAATIAAAAFGILVIERATGAVLAANPAFEQMLGYPAADLVGKDLAALGLLAAGADLGFAALARDGRVRDHEVTMTSRAGQVRQLSLNLEYADAARADRVIVSVEDVTARRAADAEQTRLRAELAHGQKMQAIGTLAGGIAHDFNNLLAGILGGLAVLEQQSGGGVDLGLIADMKAVAQRGAGIAGQLLNFARVGHVDPQPLDLGEVVPPIAAMFGRTRPDLVIALDVAGVRRRVVMDHVKLEQVLLNLLVNAGHAMPTGGHLRIAAHDPVGGAPTFVALTVADTGVGMTPEVQARIFEPFFTTRGTGDGTGLGLASVYGIVTQHGGRIEVASALGAGTTFTLHLPCVEATVRPPAPASRPPPVGVRGTVLVIDDEAMVRNVTQRILTKAGHQVLLAESGDHALEVIRARPEPIDLVLLDLTMPGLDSASTLDGIRALAPAARIILVSGYAPDERIQAMLARHCNGFIQKPFAAELLTERVAEALA